MNRNILSLEGLQFNIILRNIFSSLCHYETIHTTSNMKQHGKNIQLNNSLEPSIFAFFESLRAAVSRDIHSETHAWLLVVEGHQKEPLSRNF